MNSTSDAFIQKRRQPWLDEHYFQWAIPQLEERIALRSDELTAEGTDAEGRADAAKSIASGRLQLLLLRYTGGECIEPMREELERVLAAYEACASLRRLAHEDPDFPAFLFRDLEEYEAAFQLIGLCYLLHRRDLLPRVAAMQDPYYRAQDTLYEDLLAYEMEGRFDVDQWFHDKPYRDLINSIYRDTDDECIEELVRYLDGWYPGMRPTAWYGGHLKQADGSPIHHGYWAIGAAVATYLLRLDDSRYRDHPMYPKDLIDFARRHDADPLKAQIPDEQGSAAGSSSPRGAPYYVAQPQVATSGLAYPESGAAKAPRLPSPRDLGVYDELIGGYRTHVDQSVFLDRQEDGYGLWMYEEAEDTWQDHAEVYLPMTVDALRSYFVHPADADQAIGVGCRSGEHDEVLIAIIRARPGTALACGGVVPVGGVFAMNGSLFVPFIVDRSVGAHYVMYGVE